MYIFARLVIAHLLSDIPLNLFASEKRNGSLSSRLFFLGVHTTIVFFAALLLLVDMLNPKVVLCVLIIAVAHFLIDTLRLAIEKEVHVEQEATPGLSKREDLLRLFRFFRHPRASWSGSGFRVWFLLNALDQSLHLSVLVLAAAYLVHAQ